METVTRLRMLTEDMVCEVKPRSGRGRAHVRNRHRRIASYRCGYCNEVVVDRPSMMSRRPLLTARQPIYVTVTPAALTGSGSYAMPANYRVNSCVAEIIAPGGGARGGFSGVRNGSGAGGGAYAAGTDTVATPGATVSYDCGTAGVGSAFNTATGLTSATDAWWNSSSVVMAEGGQASSATTSAAGVGGLAANSVGNILKVDGSTGQVGSTTTTTGAGGTAASGGTLVGGAGGAGANGTTPGFNGGNQAGKAGIFPGGGGGGGRYLTGGAGAPGAAGTIQISYQIIT